MLKPEGHGRKFEDPEARQTKGNHTKVSSSQGK